jgi:hypothetical protein
VNKGIETDTNALTLEIIADTCGKDIAKVSTFLVSRTQAPLPEGHVLNLLQVWTVVCDRKYGLRAWSEDS